MNYSAEIKRQKIAVLTEVKETFQREIDRINRLIQEWEYETVENDRGDIISYADYFDLELRDS
ncbi:hypothetical protein [Dapis sp. BLCC M229]|uniref:hypothetical protein n=1 Tax=Dapis sp. BLCC M229 TaxID=3400188 RepID=UPI003CEC70E3